MAFRAETFVIMIKVSAGVASADLDVIDRKGGVIHRSQACHCVMISRISFRPDVMSGCEQYWHGRASVEDYDTRKGLIRSPVTL